MKYIISHLFIVVVVFIVADDQLTYPELNTCVAVAHLTMLYTIPSEQDQTSQIVLTIFIFALTGERRPRTASHLPSYEVGCHPELPKPRY
jgi:hypothetical protein